MSSATPAGRPRLDDRTEAVIAQLVANAGRPTPEQMDRLRSLLPPVPLPEQPTGEHDAA